MKHCKKTAILGSALLLWAGVVSAAPGSHAITAVPLSNDGATSFHGHLVGSDTLNELMDELIADMITDHDLSGSTTVGNEGYTVYDGLGSSVGQRWAEGSPNAAAGDPLCTPNDANGGNETNPGCEEITPMSRMLNNAICDDDLDDGGQTGFAAAGAPNHNYQAEGLAVCMDGVVVITDNHSLGEYGDDATACSNFAALSNTENAVNDFPDRGVGNLADTGTIDIDPPGAGAEDYTLGANALSGANAWKDALRLIYAGCTNASTGMGSGTCSGANDRVARCSSPVRAKLMQSWHLLFEGTDCGAAGNSCDNATTPADGGLRQVYRRDDGSGTSGTFLELIGIAKDPPNLLQRNTVISGIPLAATAIPNNLSFCDGGQVEGFIPTNFDGSGTPKFDLGDPIRKPCKPEDDLCAFDGRSPVVRSIRSTISPDPLDPLSAYPEFQCSKGLFARKPYITGSALKICPDGTVPNAAGCKFPYYDTPVTHVKNFDCMNASNSRPSTLPASVDGRAYNFVMHLSDGTLRKASGSGSSIMPQVASWRQNMAQLSTSPTAAAGFHFGPSALGDFVCTEADATRNIGCIVGHTTCTLGFAGREAAYNGTTSDHQLQEPVQILDSGPTDALVLSGTYKFSRKLFLNAMHGFENISDECASRGGTVNECADELDIATEFYNYDGNPLSTTNRIAPLCAQLGFIPMPTAECIGALHSAATNNVCGAPATQALSACQPH